jgi:hypothetical protein
MREIFDRLLGRVADAVEIHSKIEWAAKLLFWVILLWPTSGIVWQHSGALGTLFEAICNAFNFNAHVPDAALIQGLWVVSSLIFVFMFIKGVDLFLPRVATVAALPSAAVPNANAPAAAGLSKNVQPFKAGKVEKVEIIAPYDFKPKSLRFKRDEEPYVQIGDMLFTEKDLFTSVLITGVTGTGKTTAAVYPMLEQILSIYNEPNSNGTLGNVGGLCLDVKGEFFEAIIYYMHRAGRNIFEDIQVIRPSCMMPAVRFKDPATGFYFYLNAKPCSSGAEAWDLIRGKKFKDGSDIPLNVFTFGRRKLESYAPQLKEMVFDVGGKKLNYLGWRWQGDSLVRVTHTPAFNETHIATMNGRRIIIGAPQKLVYDGVINLDNGLRYNIVEPHKPAPEAAMRLNLISTLAEGEKQTGENAYWYKRARSHIGSCIELWRMAYDETPQCTAQAIYKITQQDDYCRKQVKVVENKIKALQEQVAGIQDFSDRVSYERDIERMTSIVKYFTEEWGKYDSKTKTIVGSVVANAFDTFNKDPTLQDSFCQPKTFSFEECINDGKIFVLVPGDEYEAIAKILGTALKMDFQSVVLSRMHRSELNQQRKIMLMNDECQKFVVAGGSQGVGDENFMSLCRQSKCFNINATQADSWIISVVGKENSDVYLQNFNGRIWFRTNDKDTAEKAEQLCGIKKQKTRSAGSEKTIHLENLFLGPKGSADHTPSFSEKEEDKPRFAKDKFYNLEMWECIMFNGTRTGGAKACQSQCEPAFVGGPEGQREVAEVMKLYFQGYLENLAYKQNGGKLFDHIQVEKKLEAEVPVLPEGTPALPPPAAGVPFATPAPTTPPTSAVGTPPSPISPVIAKPPAAAVAAPQALAPAPALSTFGDPEALKTRANKLLKSVQVIAPRVCNPLEGSTPPFTNTGLPDAIVKPTNTPAQTVSDVAADNAAKDGIPAAPLPIPLVDKNFSSENVTPRQLQAAMQNYQSNPAESIQATLKQANFIPPVNPTEYLPAQKEEELQRVSDAGLAGERAALGPKGLQGGNPNYAMAAGPAVTVPTPPTDNFERARDQALKEEHNANAKSFVKAINNQDGPAPDMDTLELLKNLKPETDERK